MTGAAAAQRPRSAVRVFVRYAAITLVPVVALGIVLSASFRSEANRRGLAEGRAEAILVARTAVQPLLGGHELSAGVNAIDRSFIADMLDNTAHAAIVRSMIDLGHNLSLRVVGEGVETDQILAQLDGSGCDVAQGFLLARPMPASDIAAWLRTTTPSTAAA